MEERYFQVQIDRYKVLQHLIQMQSQLNTDITDPKNREWLRLDGHLEVIYPNPPVKHGQL